MTKMKNGQGIAVSIIQKRRGGNNRWNHTKISISLDLGFHANLNSYEVQYLSNELRIAIRTALILQFGLRAEIIAPKLSEDEPEEELFSASRTDV